MNVFHPAQGGEIGLRLVFFLEQLLAGGGVRLTRLLHAGSDDPLEVFLNRHLELLRSHAAGEAPQQQRHGANEVRRYRPGSTPPFASRGPRWGGPLRLGAGRACTVNVARDFSVRNSV
jgi:hypothetical protein